MATETDRKRVSIVDIPEKTGKHKERMSKYDYLVEDFKKLPADKAISVILTKDEVKHYIVGLVSLLKRRTQKKVRYSYQNGTLYLWPGVSYKNGVIS
jgi:hypothetical protein